MIKKLIVSLNNEMTVKEKEIANYILNNMEEILTLTSAEMGNNIGVSQSSVIKFIKKIGFNKFGEFKIQLTKELENIKQNKDKIHSEIYLDDSLEDISFKVFNETIKAMEDTLKIIDHKYFEKIIDIIKTSKKILLVGSGMSSIVAKDLEIKLIKIRIDALHYESSHMQLMKLATMDKEDLIIAISHRGETEDVIDVIKKANKKGIKVLSITSIEKNTVANLSDFNLKVISEETNFRSSAISSRMAQLILNDIIFLRLTQIDYEKRKEYIKESRDLIKKLK
ncbi:MULTISPECIES: MurR/RpiR family transcriptional regulator [Fusobacterium]|jgi:DNA-binding MurR/RpiR family transcriptional regulator|uniref:MurR/RpiR family transcriptional regulator n=1 Tax=Fusobacterium hominis TaxID=2764326 RepID=A0A7G9GY57_9FUSO|nr:MULTISPECIES: MurR/RpiR family transcriptional regulator [Fusobacterium]QNM15739.1 MurR/RpiR family transcriptional regulator [Fusobacterium hominis]